MFVLTSKLPSTPVACSDVAPLAANVVNEPAAAELDPTVVPSIAPALISTVANVAVPSTFKFESKSTAPVTSNVPGISTLLVHSTLVPSAAVCNTCLAAPSANLDTAISAVPLISALAIVPSNILAVVIALSCISQVCINWSFSSSSALRTCVWLSFKSPAFNDEPAL